MSSKFWNSLSTYCLELAPIAGSLLDAVGETAQAVERAGQRNRSLRAAGSAVNVEVLEDENVF